jgi:Holliday junction resolvase RusA-like endonuclease
MFGDPPTATHHSKKIVKCGRFTRLADTQKLRDAISIWEARLAPHRIASPIGGPIRLTIHAVFSPPKSETSTRSKAARFEALGLVPKTSKPDCSNLAKTLEDRLVALGFIEDDKAVYSLQVLKFWGLHPRTTVTIEGMGDDNA